MLDVQKLARGEIAGRRFDLEERRAARLRQVGQEFQVAAEADIQRVRVAFQNLFALRLGRVDGEGIGGQEARGAAVIDLLDEVVRPPYPLEKAGNEATS